MIGGEVVPQSGGKRFHAADSHMISREALTGLSEVLGFELTFDINLSLAV